MRTRLLILLLVGCLGYAAPADSAKPAPTPKPKKEQKASVSDTADSAKPAPKKTEEIKRILPNISEKTIEHIAIWFFVVMLVLIILFFVQAYLRNVYLGFQSIKYIGLVIMFPGICIIALVGGDLISGETLAALLGTIAGYVLSREDDNKNDSAATTALKKEKEALQATLKDMEAKYKKEIEELKKKLPKV